MDAGRQISSGRAVVVRLGVLGHGTLSLLGPPIVGSGFRHGLLIDVIEGTYNSAVQEAADAGSRMHSVGLDFALIAGDARALGLDRAAASEEEARQKSTQHRRACE